MSKAGYITIVGRPNAGKSTLLNTILETELSIVTPKAQTTREQFAGILTEERGQIVFLDTPGIHRAKGEGMNRYMVNQAKAALESPHLIWYMVDPHSAIQHEQPVIDLIGTFKIPVILIMNKCDLLKESHRIAPKSKGAPVPRDVNHTVEKSESSKTSAEPVTEDPRNRNRSPSQSHLEQFASQIQAGLHTSGVTVLNTYYLSALKGTSVSELLDESWNSIPEGTHFFPDPDQLSDRPTRYLVSEMVRQQLYLLFRDEIPYSCAVEIENFDEKAKPIRIEAVIYVERDSQKGMVIGQAGKMIKQIGQSARTKIEQLVGEKIFLGLKVKVLKDWSRNNEGIKRAGYRDANQKSWK